MRTLLAYLFFTAAVWAQPAKLRFDGRDLLRVTAPEEETAGIRTYRDQPAGPSVPSYELGVIRIQHSLNDWPVIRESFLRAVKKRASLLAAEIRGSASDDFVVVDFAYLKPDGVTVEYAILRHSLNAKRELVTVDVRLRFPAVRKDLVARVEKDRERLVEEFIRLAEAIGK